MADERHLRHPGFEPVHPGSILRDEVLPALGLTASTAARHLGVPRQALGRVLAETAGITPAMALRIGKFCGNGPGIWLRMQAEHDLWRAAQVTDVSAVPTMRAA